MPLTKNYKWNHTLCGTKFLRQWHGMCPGYKSLPKMTKSQIELRMLAPASVSQEPSLLQPLHLALVHKSLYL